MPNFPGTRMKEITDELITEHGCAPGALLPILNRLRKEKVAIDANVITGLAETLKLAPSAIYGVVSFYSFLDSRPKGKHLIRVCQTISCEMAGARKVASALASELRIDVGETTPDGLISLAHTNCLGLCNKAPALLLNEAAHVHVDAAKVKEIVRDVFKSVHETLPSHPTEKEDRK